MQNQMNHSDVVVIGAGLSGLSAALFLAQRGFSVSLYEGRSQEEIERYDLVEGSGSGRSMSMDLSARGIYALKQVEVFNEAVTNAVPMRNKIFHGIDGALTYIPYGRGDKEHVLTVSRNHLYQCLLSAAQSKENIKVLFKQMMIDLNFDDLTVFFKDRNTNNSYTINPQIVIGADGSNSKVRSCFEKYSGVKFITTLLKQSYKEMNIPSELGVRLEQQAMHLWARDEFMFVAQPNRDHSFTGALIMPEFGHAVSFANIKTGDQITKLFHEFFPDLLPLLPNLAKEYEEHPLGHLRLLQGPRWTINGNMLLLGDAAHGMVPFFGQGVNCCFEDCTVLNECLDQAHDQWPIALTLFNERRVRNGNAICAMSYENFPELHHSHVRDTVLLKKQIDVALIKRYSSYVSYHNLVYFHRVPYLYAMAIKGIQEPLLQKLSQGIKSVDELNWALVDEELKRYNNQVASLRGVFEHAN
jgi:kynurenine 3-monooxygenase